ncbi:GTP cyclohydrolase I FolE [Francisella tularensis]|uniref:GTP cyclohydrolase I FolE n=1 Tax=Francisella tularensis TaxID=263 RepID=UPI001022E784|nr:GTP cyclohydrolase I FolE [Francisella tularensis]MDN9006823.1 GTP cyclohydrolase I FolE [Francisella tularensis subsp. mediasiatica]RZP35217.1 GTP cyclohydrolase I FolE [Francisella tularensis subsp. mediasiatica]RZP38899.1 GTP cyclohydrolase I FolE [Francisella tularensis subsp. mediasiatica]RZP44595.1 GTP cyclohydrolase I FolE [Francisella tularensis subsp. mediasiatica]WKL71531.1 GTP cyclohydrolase I FolE [Francisella tularensis subsp. mediasiatica]
MMMKDKYCSKLGKSVQKHLIKLGLEQPREFNLDNDNKITIITKAYRQILDALGLYTDEFEKTPFRVARMFTQEIFNGLDYANFPACALYENEFNYTGVLTQKNITIMSFCEHHFVPFEGTAEVSFIPKNNNIIGLCRINSICDFFSRRPQIQERMTAQIFEALKFILSTEDVSVKIKAKHACVSLRGVNNQNSQTYTQMVGGVFAK